jgi:hypothetical protein
MWNTITKMLHYIASLFSRDEAVAEAKVSDADSWLKRHGDVLFVISITIIVLLIALL